MNSGDFNSPFHESEVEALEESVRLHPARGFMLPRYTVHCPSCGRGVPKGTLESPHYAPESKPLCASCRSNWAKWYRSPEQRAASARAREERRKRGVKPAIGFPVE
jgi:transposase-like protein